MDVASGGFAPDGRGELGDGLAGGEAVTHAERLEAAGIPTSYLDVPGHVHGSLSIPKMYDADSVESIYAARVPSVCSPLAATTP